MRHDGEHLRRFVCYNYICDTCPLTDSEDCYYRVRAEIKKVIKENPRVILYFGSDWDSFVAAAKATGGFTLGRTNNCTELCLLYANGKYDGFNREDSIEFFKMDFHAKKAYYNRWTAAGREKDDEWLLVDLSRNRKARVV